jgi:hypothetical protein
MTRISADARASCRNPWQPQAPLNISTSMKIHRFTVLAALLTSPAFAQTNTFPASGNVGIGTTSPGHTLDVMGNIHSPHSGIFGDGHWSTENINYEALSTYGGATIRGNTMVVGKFSIGTWTQSAQPNGLFVAGVSLFDGNVGIGTMNPGAKLEVNGNALYHDLVRFQGAANVPAGMSGVGGEIFAAAGNVYFQGFDRTNNGYAPVHFYGSGFAFINGRVGIGTLSPSATLQVNGNVLLNSSATAVTSGFNGEFGNPNVGNSGGFRVNRNSGTVGTKIFSSYHSNSGHEFYHEALSSIDSRFVFLGGNVGIGTSNPQHKLAVNGTIKAKEVIVETTGWSDYVFADDYRLAPLAEVEAHIKTNKHLPGIPSAAQVAENGVNLGDVQAALLAKVEELTLHLIAQEKNLAAQQNQLSTQQQAMQNLQRENAALQTRLQQLETR